MSGLVQTTGPPSDASGEVTVVVRVVGVPGLPVRAGAATRGIGDAPGDQIPQMEGTRRYDVRWRR